MARSATERWVTLEVEPAFPAAGFLATAALDDVVFLSPVRGGSVEVEPLTRRQLLTGVAHHITYLDEVGLFALRAMFGFGLPALAPWPLRRGPTSTRIGWTGSWPASRGGLPWCPPGHHRRRWPSPSAGPWPPGPGGYRPLPGR
ncbi:MAG: hypothetical protein KY452_02795 [Actinobacteria bacterium]|nr:hypothetical protein [Actinomycetota bacterium]